MSKVKPRDQKLYDSVKAKVYRANPIHSAYRSGMVVKQYKAAYSRKYGKTAKPYISVGKKDIKPSKTGLARWFKEEWRNQRGEVGYQYESDIYRPTKRITAKTPKTFNELKPKKGSDLGPTLKRARRSKAKTGRAHFQ